MVWASVCSYHDWDGCLARREGTGPGNGLRKSSLNSSPQNSPWWEHSLGKYCWLTWSTEAHGRGHHSPACLLPLRPSPSPLHSGRPRTGRSLAHSRADWGESSFCYQGPCSGGESFMRRITSGHTRVRNLRKPTLKSRDEEIKEKNLVSIFPSSLSPPPFSMGSRRPYLLHKAAS